MLDLDLTLRVLVDGERVDHPDGSLSRRRSSSAMISPWKSGWLNPGR